MQINVLTEQENTRMIAMLRAIAARIGAELAEDPHLLALSEETELARPVRQIKEREEK